MDFHLQFLLISENWKCSEIAFASDVFPTPIGPSTVINGTPSRMCPPFMISSEFTVITKNTKARIIVAQDYEAERD